MKQLMYRLDLSYSEEAISPSTSDGNAVSNISELEQSSVQIIKIFYEYIFSSTYAVLNSVRFAAT